MRANKVPQIRFRGFSGEWEDSGFSETFANIPNNTLSRDELNYNFGLAKNIHYGDVLIKFGELLDIQKQRIPFISNNDYVNKLKSAKLQNGDIVIADAAEDEIVGKCTEILNIERNTVLSGLHTIPVRPTQSFASKYLGYYMNSSAYHNQLLPLLQGTKVLSISKSAIKNTMIYYPSDSLEQTKIGNYFQNLDHLIEQKEKKHKKLVQLKKAMLEKMFPKDGEDTPEIRFKGFSGEWEETEIGKIFNYIRPDEYIVKSTEYSKEFNTPVLTANKAFILGFTNEKNTFNKPCIIFDDFTLDFKFVNFPYMVKSSAMKILILKDDKLNNLEFVYNLLKITKIEIMGHSRHYISVVQKTNVYTPKKEEQTKIGNYFQKLDKLIDLQLQELEKLKNIKKASLDKMFV